MTDFSFFTRPVPASHCHVEGKQKEHIVYTGMEIIEVPNTTDSYGRPLPDTPQH